MRESPESQKVWLLGLVFLAVIYEAVTKNLLYWHIISSRSVSDISIFMFTNSALEFNSFDTVYFFGTLVGTSTGREMRRLQLRRSTV